MIHLTKIHTLCSMNHMYFFFETTKFLVTIIIKNDKTLGSSTIYRLDFQKIKFKQLSLQENENFSQT